MKSWTRGQIIIALVFLLLLVLWTTKPIHSMGAGLVAWMRDWAGEGFWVGVLEWFVDVAAIGAIAVASFFLFPAVMATIMAFLLDDIAQAFDGLSATLPGLKGAVVFVSNEVGLGIVPDNAMARAFRDHAGRLHQSIAGLADEVHFVAAGLPLKMKG